MTSLSDSPESLLELPSFGYRIRRNNPQAIVKSQYRLQAGDAVSITLPPRVPVDPDKLRTWRDFLPDCIGVMRGLLLAILEIEDVGTGAYIRLSDLRLASVLESRLLQRGLKPALEELQEPITAKRVADWKRNLLGEELPLEPGDDALLPTEAAENSAEARKPIRAKRAVLKSFGDEDAGIRAVSFAAAALWLFLDLNTPDFRDATPYRLTELIRSLADIVRAEMEHVDRSAQKLEKLTANRPVQRPADPEFKDYEALQDYRMGTPLKDIAEWLGITPWNGEKGEGNKKWKSGVREHLIKGKKFEDEHHPRVAAIFAKNDDPQVQRTARLAYAEYGHKGFISLINWHHLCTMIQAECPGTEVDREIAEAFLLLGESIERGTKELP